MDKFSIDQTSLEDVSKSLGELYSNVKISREPMFAWVQIVNDVTVLGEDLRRERYAEAVHQAGDVLTRLLEFLGYYLFIHKGVGHSDFADIVAETLRKPAYADFMPNGMMDGPSWWVVYKYPFVCAKCGKVPCHCLIEPWVLENRREDPGPYLAKFRKEAEDARCGLRGKDIAPFTIRSLIEHFCTIYRASYYHQEPWKIGMHLSEELGEAMTELGRMEIVCRARGSFQLTQQALNKVFTIVRDKLDAETRRIKDLTNLQQRRQQLANELSVIDAKLRNGDPWETLATMIGERFKEEVADILSWLSAIVVKLDPQLKEFEALPKKFTKVIEGGVEVLQCPWCRQESCSDHCLVLHGVSGEIRETVSKF